MTMVTFDDINEGVGGFGGRMEMVQEAFLGVTGNYVEEHRERAKCVTRAR